MEEGSMQDGDSDHSRIRIGNDFIKPIVNKIHIPTFITMCIWGNPLPLMQEISLLVIGLLPLLDWVQNGIPRRFVPVMSRFSIV